MSTTRVKLAKEWINVSISNKPDIYTYQFHPNDQSVKPKDKATLY